MKPLLNLDDALLLESLANICACPEADVIFREIGNRLIVMRESAVANLALEDGEREPPRTYATLTGRVLRANAAYRQMEAERERP